ncbi:hypothetical protein BpHYR1_017103 [Brachionus plicatilis]|uniref:Uncharacterized protein n=1 Tax=Brachionus plicatilis TaxID=10195 RepID=A0A3M7RUE1_BRAPC|nr:hypothetical protein BpHYR1_017103 [Brachionus plicatilis]
MTCSHTECSHLRMFTLEGFWPMPLGTVGLRSAQRPTLEDALWMCITSKTSLGLSISDDLMIAQARKFGEEIYVTLWEL